MPRNEKPPNGTDTNETGKKLDFGKRVYGTPEGDWTHTPQPSPHPERKSRSSSGSELLQREASNLESSAVNMKKSADKAPFAALVGDFEQATKENVQRLAEMKNEAEGMALQAKVIRAGLDAIEKGEAPSSEFQSLIDMRLEREAKGLRVSKDEFNKKHFREKLAAYQEVFDSIDAMKGGK
jgi:hypothetical protein